MSFVILEMLLSEHNTCFWRPKYSHVEIHLEIKDNNIV